MLFNFFKLNSLSYLHFMWIIAPNNVAREDRVAQGRKARVN